MSNTQLFQRLPVGSQEFDEVSSLVENTCKNQCIISIEKLIYEDLINKYEKYKDSLTTKGLTIKEIYGFHGTSNALVDEIATTGFKKEFNKVSAYGLGTYLASSFGYSKAYAKLGLADYPMLFVCKFVYHNICKGKNKQKCPDGYDVQTNDLLKSSIYIV
jgi:hypothetical protein